MSQSPISEQANKLLASSARAESESDRKNPSTLTVTVPVHQSGETRAQPCSPPTQDPAILRWRTGRVQQQIEQGTYDEDAALDAVLDKLAQDLGVTLED